MVMFHECVFVCVLRVRGRGQPVEVNAKQPEEFSSERRKPRQALAVAVSEGGPAGEVSAQTGRLS